jgi:hypothetical protein
MTTESTQHSFDFQPLGSRQVTARFDGGRITTEGGALLLREVARKTGLLRRFSECFRDHRDPERIEHTVEELVSQRVYGLALGYEDLNDHDELRSDPMLAVLVGKKDPSGQQRRRTRDEGKPLAAKSTLNRLELTPANASQRNRYKKIAVKGRKVDELFLEHFVDSHDEPPAEVILDLDCTDDPVHGEQEGRFFHGYYGHYCYLPLYVFCGELLLCARLRPSNIDASAGATEELERIVGRLREAWPEVKIIIRADSGFARESIMRWCEEHDVDYVLGLARNARLVRAIGRQLRQARIRHHETGKAARVFRELSYRTRKSWSRKRRVVAKAEHLSKGSNPRFVVTSLGTDEVEAQRLYEQLYCARGDMENRIKEQQLYLFADRTSSSRFRTNQLRLWFSSVAYLLLQALRRLGLEGTSMERAQCHTIRHRLLKIGAQLRLTVRRIWVSMASGCPYEALYSQVFANLTQRRGLPGSEVIV